MPDVAVVLADGLWGANGDGGVVLADGYRCVNGDGGAVPTMVRRKVIQDGRAVWAGGTRNPLRVGSEVGRDNVDRIGTQTVVSMTSISGICYTTYQTNV